MSRVLVRGPNHLGDSLMAQPAIRSLVKYNRNDKINLLIPEWAAAVYNNIDNIELLPLENKYLHGANAVIFQRDLLRKEKFDTGILLTPSFSSALILFISGVKNRCGYKGNWRNLLLNMSLESKNNPVIHRSKIYLCLIESFVGNRLDFEPPRIMPSEKTIAMAGTILKKSGLNRTEGFITIAPQAVAESRRWGNDNYAALAGMLMEKTGFKIVLVGSSGERLAGENIVAGRKGIINICGLTDIDTAAAVISLSSVFIGNDSGLAHLAAAVNTPLLVLSGADRPSETSPVSEKKTVIIKDELDCISCVKNICPKKGDAFMKCMKNISIDEVFDAGIMLLK